MYLFSRTTRLSAGHGTAGIDWAVSVAAKVAELTGHQVEVWATVYSPGFGTIGWTAWFDSMAALEAMGDQLTLDAAYNDLANRGAELTDGTFDDGLVQVIHGTPDPERNVQYVVGTQALVAAGAFERAMGVSIGLVDHGQEVTGIGGLFGRALTGDYGAVGFLTGYESVAEMEHANDQLGADPAWLQMIDATKGCFVEAPGATSTTIYRKVA